MSEMRNTYDNYYKPLKPEPDAEDLALHEKNCSPKLITDRLRQLVPLLEFSGCRVDSVSTAETVLVVPLRHSAVNQNGTQQRVVFGLR